MPAVRRYILRTFTRRRDRDLLLTTAQLNPSELRHRFDSWLQGEGSSTFIVHRIDIEDRSPRR